MVASPWNTQGHFCETVCTGRFLLSLFLNPPQVPFTMNSTDDRGALVALFRATNGVNWLSNDNWDTNAEVSSWYGVAVNDQGRVVALSLSFNNLRGKSFLVCIRRHSSYS